MMTWRPRRITRIARQSVPLWRSFSQDAGATMTRRPANAPAGRQIRVHGTPSGEPSMFTLLTRHDFTAFAHMAIHVLLGTTAPNRLLWHVEAMAHVVEEIT